MRLEEGCLVMYSIVFAESSMGFSNLEDAQQQFASLSINYITSSPESAWLAGQIFLRYRREGGPRQYFMPDFLIAAHQADRLADLDRGYLRTYFPGPLLLTPAP
jgi:predicted nucleic acid-binding protein